jgi:sugar phosphate isomerase/epimerase
MKTRRRSKKQIKELKMSNISRRNFMVAGAGFAAALSSGCAHGLFGQKAKFKLAMAGYTLNKFKVDEALDFCRDHGFTQLCVKNFHLPYNATKSEMAEFRRKCADRGVTPYAVGPISIYTADEAKRYFDYAANLGVPIVVGVPGKKNGPKWIDCHSDRALCEVCSKLADEYDIRFAIHNHGRNPKTGNPNLYPAVPETMELIHDLSPRMGLCVDWAYTYADGLDCVEIAHKYASRIFDGHVRCLSDAKNGSAGINPAGRVFDYDGIFKALKEIGYEGRLGLELANAFPGNPQWIDESREYFTSLMN